MSWHGREKPQPNQTMSELPENSESQQKAVANDALFGVEAEKRRVDQLALNCKWLVDKIDRIHAALCPGQHGTWQQRAEQAVKAAESLPPNEKGQR